MSYSCPDFVDSIIEALGVTIPLDDAENPAAQADIALAEIQRLQRFEKGVTYALTVLRDVQKEQSASAIGQFVARCKVLAAEAGHASDEKIELPPLGVIAIICNGGLVQDVVACDERLIGANALVIDHDTEGAENIYRLVDNKGRISEAVLSDHVIVQSSDIDVPEAWRKFTEEGPNQ